MLFLLTLRALRSFGLIAFAAALAGAAPSTERMEALFRPFLAERITLSPDGRYVAYTQQTGSDLAVVIMDVDRPTSKTTLIVDEDRVIEHSKERQRAALRFLRWATPTRLVFAPTVYVIPPAVKTVAPGFTPPAPVVIAPIMAVDADGGNPRTLVDATTFQEIVGAGGGATPVARMRAATILGFLPGNRERLLVQVPGVGGREATPAKVFQLDVHNGKLAEMSSEVTPRGQIYDLQGRARLLREGGYARRPQQTFLYRTVYSGRWRKLHEVTSSSEAARFTVSPETYFGERAMPLGFDFDPNVLIYASNVGRDTFGVYGLNLATMQRTDLAIEHSSRDLSSLAPDIPAASLVFDEKRQKLAGVRAEGAPLLTVWVDSKIAEVQRSLEVKFPRRSVEILEWDDARARFLVRVTGGTDPGRIYVWQKDEGLLLEIFRRAPWLPNAALHDSRLVEFAGPDGAQLSGYLTLPRAPRLKPPPLVIVFASGLPATPHAEFDREAQVLADLGLAVLRLNQRGVLGRGARQREALREGIDRAAAQDARAAIAWVASQHPIDRKRVVAMGEGFGGYLAVRATQLEPELFRCAVATEPLLEPARWVQPRPDFTAGPPSFQQEVNRIYLERTAPRLHEIGVTSHADALSHPVFVVYRSHRADTIAEGVAQLRSQLKRRDIEHQMLAVGDDYFHGLPGARAKAYRALEEFLNLNLYNYNVKIGPTRVVR